MTRQSTTVVHLLNGILVPPAERHAWTDDAATWIEANTSAAACPDEYWAGVILAKLLHRVRVRWFARRLARNAWRRQIIVAHSNGCRIAVDALKLVPQVHITRLVLLAGAVNADFDVNGLNAALTKMQVARCIVGVSTHDEALKLADESRWCRDPLGRFGPVNADYWKRSEALTVVDVSKLCYGHSTWFDRVHFEDTLRLAVGPNLLNNGVALRGGAA